MEAPPLARLARIVTIHETAKSLVCTESQWRVRVGAFWSGGAADRAVRSPLQPCNEARRIPAPKSGTTDRCLIVLLLLGISDCSAYSRAFAARGIHDRPAAHLRRAQSRTLKLRALGIERALPSAMVATGAAFVSVTWAGNTSAAGLSQLAARTTRCFRAARARRHQHCHAHRC